MSSRKKGGGGRNSSKTERLEKMARKRDERAVHQAYRKKQQMESYLADDENFTSFAHQMATMGLQLRDIPGDGNCLFRALGDQIQGHGRNHHKFRLEVAKYVLEHRADFEPFVEDDVPFERHVANLKKLGTYAGNDAIVAFARLHTVNVVIHQLNSPMWTIKGTEKPGAPELHISYHNGDHYSSVRRIGDNTETPANITIKKGAEGISEAVKTFQKAGNYGGAASYSPPYSDHSVPQLSSASAYMSSVTYEENDSDYDNVEPDDYPSPHKVGVPAAAAGVARAYRDANDVVEQVMDQTGCSDRLLVQQTLEEHNYDVETTLLIIQHLSQAGSAANSDSGSLSSYHTNDSGIWSENGTASRIFGGPDTGAATAHHHHQPHPHQAMVNGHTLPASSTTNSKYTQLTNKERKEQARKEKKLRAMERHRQRLRGDVAAEADIDTTEVTHNMGVLQI